MFCLYIVVIIIIIICHIYLSLISNICERFFVNKLLNVMTSSRKEVGMTYRGRCSCSKYLWKSNESFISRKHYNLILKLEKNLCFVFKCWYLDYILLCLFYVFFFNFFYINCLRSICLDSGLLYFLKMIKKIIRLFRIN